MRNLGEKEEMADRKDYQFGTLAQWIVAALF